MSLLSALFGALGICAGGTLYALREGRRLSVTELRLTDPALPAGLCGLSIAFVSDIHHGPFHSRRRLAEVVDRANGLGAELVLLGGDYVQHHPRYIEPCFAELARLSAPLGVYGVLGNHDHWEDAAATRSHMAAAGITLLDNHAVWLRRNDARLRLGGVGDLWEDTPDLTPTLEGVRPDDFVLLLCHNPDFAESLATDHVNLVLSGHTHGGQCTFFGLWAPFIPSRYGQKYRGGVVETPRTRVVVSRGVGNGTPPVRFCAPAEILSIVLDDRPART